MIYLSKVTLQVVVLLNLESRIPNNDAYPSSEDGHTELMRWRPTYLSLQFSRELVLNLGPVPLPAFETVTVILCTYFTVKVFMEMTAS